MAFRTSEILPSKNKVKQKNIGLARRQNNGDINPPSKNRCTIIVIPIINSLFTEDFWERTHNDSDGKILRVTTIERFFFPPPASICYAN